MAARELTGLAPYGLLGRVLGHSWSPKIHSLLGSAPYDLHELEPEELAPFVRQGDWKGLNVTIPYKRPAFELADEVSDAARRLGVANTLVKRADGTIFADNTDLPGFAWMLDRFCRNNLGGTSAQALGGRPVLLLGSGGASRAVGAALADAGAQVTVISRKGPETYESIATRHADAELVVNTTPVGMFPKCPASPLEDATFDALTHLRGVVDVVYNPTRTGICLQAELRGLPYQSGLGMLVAQARFSSQSFQGRELPDALVEKIERQLLRETGNVILIGMPGSGKTSTGRQLARATGRPFIDLDDAFTVDHGITPADCIRERGEDAFRELETQTAATRCGRSGLIIACGGGIVTRRRNYPLLHQNGTIVMINRPLEQLSSAGRPLSQSAGVNRLAQERLPLYRSWSDVAISCTGSAAGDARMIQDLLRI